MSMSTEHVFVAITLVLSIAGFAVGLYSLSDALHEERVARRVNGVRYIYARSTLRSQSMRTYKLLAFATIAVNSLFTYDNRRLVSIVLLLTVIAVTSLDAILDRVTSHKIVHHLLGYEDGVRAARDRHPAAGHEH